MTKRRGNNEGSIHRLPSGTWRAQVRLNGKRLGFTSETQRKAQEWFKNIRLQIDDGLTYSSSKTTVGEFYGVMALKFKRVKTFYNLDAV